MNNYLPLRQMLKSGFAAILLSGILCSSLLDAQEKLHFERILTIAGNGQSAKPTNGQAKSTAISNPFGIHPTPGGSLIIVSYDQHVLFELDPAGERVEVIAGTGKKGSEAKNGEPAVKVELNGPHEIQVDAAGNIYVADTFNHRVGKINRKNGQWTTIVGTGQKGFSGDGGPATEATFNQAYSIALDGKELFVADLQNHRVRKVDLESGVVDTICGTGVKKMPKDGEPAIEQPLAGPRSLAVDPNNLWIVLREGNSVWRIDRKSGRIHHVAGTGKKGFSGDGGPAKKATLAGPKGIAVLPGKAVIVADTENHAIRMIDLASGTIFTLVGATGKKGFDKDGTLPTNRKLARPHGVFLKDNGNLLIGDSENHRVRVLTNTQK